jgi:glutamate carboxypeptidase
MSNVNDALDWIDTQAARLPRLVSEWASINSGSDNLAGLNRMRGVLREAFASLPGRVEEVPLAPRTLTDSRGQLVGIESSAALRIRCRPDAPLRVLLGIHFDTVYGVNDPFQKVERLDDLTLRGPGVTDAKGGLAVMLVALEAFERSGLGDRLGWEVVVTPDEEIGSPSGVALWREAAGRNHLGLLFEPAMDDHGTLVGSRGGSGSWAIVFRGRAAHAGRAFHDGRNAVVAAAAMALGLDALNHQRAGVTINIARIDGGGPLNVVPDLAILRFNVRIDTAEQADWVKGEIDKLLEQARGRDGVTVDARGGAFCAPKPLDEPTRRIFDHVGTCAAQLGLPPIALKHSRGISDGNRLAAAGLPNVDSLGPRGGRIHSPEEYLLLDSLPERAKLTALLLMKLATGELAWPMKG